MNIISFLIIFKENLASQSFGVVTTSKVRRHECYDCYQWELNSTSCDNCVESCKYPTNQTELFASTTKACFFEYFVGTVKSNISLNYGLTCEILNSKFIYLDNFQLKSGLEAEQIILKM